MFLPSAQVTSRECAKFDPSRARQPYTVTVSPTFIVSRVQPCRRSMLGGKPSNPMDDTRIVLHIQVKMNVRIFSVHLGDNAGDGDRFAFVVFRPERMVRPCANRPKSSGGKGD